MGTKIEHHLMFDTDNDGQGRPRLGYDTLPLLAAYDRGVRLTDGLIASTHCSYVDGKCVACANGAIFLGANPTVPRPTTYKEARAINSVTWGWRAAHGYSAEVVFSAIERFNDNNVTGRDTDGDAVRNFIIEMGYADLPVANMSSVQIVKPDSADYPF